MPSGQRPAHLLELRAGRHLLGVDRGLDAVEEPLEPADELGLRDPELGVRRRGVLGEGQRESLELLDQLRGEAALELLDRRPVDLLEPVAAGVVERSRLHLFEELPDHAADAHHLRRLLDQVGELAEVVRVLVATLGLTHGLGGHGDGLAVRADHDDVLLTGLLLAHAATLQTGGCGQATSTILPVLSPLSMSRCASAASASGRVRPTIARTVPSATSGQTCSATAAQIVVFSPTGRARRLAEKTAARLWKMVRRSISAFDPPWKPRTISRPSMAKVSRFRVRYDAPMLSRMTSAP